MLSILSPAKTFSVSTNGVLPKTSTPLFPEKTNELVSLLQSYSVEDISALMHISPKLSHLNYDRFQNWKTAQGLPALHTFDGDVYRGLKKKPLSDQNWKNANTHIALLSGLYGVLRPTDSICPYRLEMRTRLSVQSFENLSSFWTLDVTHALNQLLKENHSLALIQLASQEYAAAVDFSKLMCPVIDIRFLDDSPKGLRIVSMYAKRARGLFARYILDHQLKNPQDLRSFQDEGYVFSSSRSNDSTFTFVRPAASLSALKRS